MDGKTCKFKNRFVYLQRVFHSIRFKVNKGWSTAVLLFLCRLFKGGDKTNAAGLTSNGISFLH